MIILEEMDRLLDEAEGKGACPRHFVMRHADWNAIRSNLVSGVIDDPARIGDQAYLGIPVRFGSLHQGAIVALVDGPDGRVSVA
jgi:hypothetical protein